MNERTVDQDDAPLVVLELIQRLRIRDVMARRLVTASRSESMRRVQTSMKRHGLRMVPIAEMGRLYGVVSMGDILEAMERRTLHEPCGLHMTPDVVALEADMPLSFAVTYFGRYDFGAFPVLDRTRHLVGVVTVRDINMSLLREMSKELKRLETANADLAEASPEKMYLLREFKIRRHDFATAGNASNRIRRYLVGRGGERGVMRRIAVVAYELEMNLVVHSLGGTLSFLIASGRAEITARDEGPGIRDVEWALRDGTTTAGDWIRSLGFGAGMGLPNARRAADEFTVRSRPGRGTVVRAVVYMPRPVPGPSGEAMAVEGANDSGGTPSC